MLCKIRVSVMLMFATASKLSIGMGRERLSKSSRACFIDHLYPCKLAVACL